MTDFDALEPSDRFQHFEPADHVAAYRGVHERVIGLVRSASPAALDANAPATPAWRARDVVAHIVGVAADVANGNLEGVTTDPWTAAQVDARRDRSVDELIDEWNATVPQIDSIIMAMPTSVTAQLIADVVTHEHDLRHALGCPGARDTDALSIGVIWIIGILGDFYDGAGDPALRIESESIAITAGTGAVGGTVRASTFELGRAIVGRRTVGEIAAYEWTPSPCPERLLVLPLFTPRTTSLAE
jgi:uncharacterized protein (TIGR03083 family)